MAGYRELLAVEWDNNAVATFKMNFPGIPVYHGDITSLSVDECLKLAGIKSGELDVLDGSPPCQGFSTAGKRKMNDSRNQLFWEFVRLLQGLQPKVFVMENVSGMVKGKMKLIFAEILRELKACGYQVKAWLLNAKHYNVPQSRERMIFIGVRNDLRIDPTYPLALTGIVCAACAIEGLRDTVNPYGIRNFNQARRYLLHHSSSPTLTRSEVPGSDLPFYRGNRIADKCAAVIGSFPARFEFSGDWKDAVSRIANSVPPLFMRAIARHIREIVLNA